MAVSATQLYWAVVDPNTNGAAVVAASLDGSGAHAIVSGLDDATGVVVGGSHLYWANAEDSSIGEANLNGTGAHTIIGGQDTPEGVAVG